MWLHLIDLDVHIVPFVDLEKRFFLQSEQKIVSFIEISWRFVFYKLVTETDNNTQRAIKTTTER